MPSRRPAWAAKSKPMWNSSHIHVGLFHTIPFHTYLKTFACAPSHSCSFVGLAKAIEKLLEGPEREHPAHPKLHLLLLDQLMKVWVRPFCTFVLGYFITLSSFTATSLFFTTLLLFFCMPVCTYTFTCVEVEGKLKGVACGTQTQVIRLGDRNL